MQSIGVISVPSPGTPVRVSASSLKCFGVNFQAVKSIGPVVTNVGYVYVGYAGLNKSTGAGLLYILAPYQVARSPVIDVHDSLDDANQYFIDADNANDGVLCTAL